MILFLEDWKKYPTAIIHTATKNTSWLRMAALYKSMKVENYFFHLALIDRDLEYIDPYDYENLTLELQVKIRKECVINPWYYLREIARIKPQASNKLIPVRANRGNLSLWWLFLNHITVFLMQIRQTGKSVSSDKIIEWVLDFGGVNTTIALYTKDDDLRVANVGRIKGSRKLVPDFLYAHTSKDTDNTFEVTNKTLDNSIKTFVAQKDKSAANNRGRGMTVPIVWGDEGPFAPNVDVTISAMLGATSAARAEAKENGRPYGNIFTTTAGDRATREGKFMFNLFQGAMPWTETLFDCFNWDELYSRVELGSRSKDPDVKTLVGVACVFNHLQLGHTDEWLKGILSNVTGTDDEINKDYFNRWGSGGKNNPIDKQLLAIAVESEAEPVFVQPFQNMYTIYWWVSDPYSYIDQNHCVISMDTSDGVGRDAIVLTFINSKTLETVGKLSVNETNIFRFTDFMGMLLLQFQNTTLIPERKSSGKSIVDGIVVMLVSKGINPFDRIFNIIINELDSNEKFRAIYEETRRCLTWLPEQFDPYLKYFGYVTAGSGTYSRAALYEDTLIEALKKSATVIRDKNLIAELSGLESKNNRIDHSTGGHDDAVVSWLLGCWLLMFGKNLKLYGISNPLSRVRDVSNLDEDPERAYGRKQRNNILRTQIEALIGELGRSRDPIIQMQITNQIERLKTQLTNETDILSINGLYESVRQSRKTKVRNEARSLYSDRPERNRLQVNGYKFM